MDLITLRAHFNDERDAWLLLSEGGLETAYGENEVEYSLGYNQGAEPQLFLTEFISPPICSWLKKTASECALYLL